MTPSGITEDGGMPDIDLRHLEVTLRISTHAGDGFTQLDFEAARLFEYGSDR